MTLPSPTILKTVNGLSDQEQLCLGATDYLGVVCTSLLLDRPLGGFYVTNITDSGIPITGVIEMGSVLKPEHLGGNYLVYLPKYVDSCDPALEESTDRIHERCIATLSSMYPTFHPEQVQAIQTAKARYVMAIPTLHYSDNRCPIVSSVPGLYLLNSARIVDGTLNVNEVLRLVENEFEETIWPDHQVS
jgi:protoporphyrinogen oxidase